MERETVLRADKLTRRYGDLLAVNSLSFEVFRGEIFGFLGPNGAGKTTTMKMLAGLLKPDSGTVQINGQDFRGNASRCLKSIGICPQHMVIWEGLTCLEQLQFMGAMYEMPPAEARERSLALLETMGLQEKRNRLAKTLSGGMQRRLNMALALVHNPGIVFLDEPQAGLDPQSRLLVRDFIKSMKDRVTVLLTTHDMEEAEKLSDRVCIIDHGQVLVTGTVDEIKKSTGQGDIYEVEIRGDVKTGLLDSLGNLDRISGLKQVSESAITFQSQDDTILAEVLQMLRQGGIALENLRKRKKSLEDVFISLTGRGLRE